MLRFNIDDYLRRQKYYATENRYRAIEKAIRVIKERQWVDENEYDYDDKDENSDSNGYICRPEYVKYLQIRLNDLTMK